MWVNIPRNAHVHIEGIGDVFPVILYGQCNWTYESFHKLFVLFCSCTRGIWINDDLVRETVHRAGGNTIADPYTCTPGGTGTINVGVREPGGEIKLQAFVHFMVELKIHVGTLVFRTWLQSLVAVVAHTKTHLGLVCTTGYAYVMLLRITGATKQHILPVCAYLVFIQLEILEYAVVFCEVFKIRSTSHF